jgi:hypothetical protein
MAMNLIERACVLVGSLNPEILQSPWLIRHNIVPPAKEAGVEFNFPLNQARMTLGPYTWIPGRRSLIVIVEEGADAGAFVAGVLDQLKHTPVDAVGNNFVFQIPSELGRPIGEACSSRLSTSLPSQVEPYVGGVATTKLSHGDAVLSVQVELDASLATLVRMNFHREAGDAVSAAQAARSWPADLAAAKEIADRMEAIARP